MKNNKRKYFLMIVLAFSVLSSGWGAASELNEFSSDGCSLFPDGTLKDRTLWCDCCFNHDISYWRGGSDEDRREADKTLRQCVLARTGSKLLSETMYDGVRVGGSPVFPTWYRWGYGWNYGRGYKQLTNDEQKHATDLLEKYDKTHPGGYCRKKY